MGMRPATLQEVAQDELSAGVVCLTGGHDITNTPFLTFPAAVQTHLETWKVDRLEWLLRHYVHWLSVTSQVHSVACVADLQHASKDVINVIVEAVEKLELSCRGTVSALYLIKPTNKAKSKALKKLLGVKPSKKHPKIPLFKVVLMKTQQELFTQIDVCHLTSDLGGILTYDHMAWLKFYETVAPCLRDAGLALRRAPDLVDRVELLQDYDIHTHSVADIQHLLNELTQSYHLQLSDAHFQESVDRCKQTLLVLDSAEESERWLIRVPPSHVQHASGCVRELYKKLDQYRAQLDELWRGIEDNVKVHLQIQRHRERAVEIERRMTQHYKPLMKEHPCVGTTLSQAELYRTHFTTTLYEPAKELLSQATEILEDVYRLRDRTSPSCDVSDILKGLRVALQPFTQELQFLQDTYVAVHIFHLLFQKALTWYRKVLRFLPEGLQERVTEGAGGKVLAMPPEWHDTVHSFLGKHPPPREQHIARLDTEIPPQVDRTLRAQARSLALRLRLLQRLLCSRRLPVKLLTTVFRWKADAGSGNNNNSTNPGAPSPDRDKTAVKASTPPTQDHPPAGAESCQPPPPKPVRLFKSLRPVTSFSSSDAGEADYASLNLLDRPSFSADSFTEGEGDQDSTDNNNTVAVDGEDQAERKPSSPNGSVAEYTKPPRISIKIISANQNSDSKSTDDEVKMAAETDSREGELTGDERFIPLTLSPTATSRQVSEMDDSLDSEDFSFRYPDVPTGSESGIEAEANSPWESIIDKIKAVSNSNLPNDVKIHCVSHLLSNSKLSSDQPRRQTERSGTARLAGQQRRDPQTRHNPPGFDYFQQRFHPSDLHRHTSFAIAADDGMRPYARTLPNGGMLASTYAGYDSGGGGLYERRQVSPWGSLDQRDHYHPPGRHGRSAHAVAKMRQRLARSLMDLDAIDNGDDTTDMDVMRREHGRFRRSSAAEQRKHPPDLLMSRSRSGGGSGASGRHGGHRRARGYHHGYSDNGWTEDEMEAAYGGERRGHGLKSLTRSCEGGLDTLHHAPAKRPPSTKLASWRSHEDGLDSMGRGASDTQPSFDSREVSRILEDCLEPSRPPGPRPHGRASLPQTKNPQRWRQGILGEQSSSPAKGHRKSKEFIAPSFLKPFHSMHNLHVQSELSPDFDLSSPQPLHDDDNQLADHSPDDLADVDQDQLSGALLLHSPRSNLDRLSDEVDQEYMSQDEVMSSLERSERILLDAEEQLSRQRGSVTNQMTSSSEEEDTEMPDIILDESTNSSSNGHSVDTEYSSASRAQPEGLDDGFQHSDFSQSVHVDVHEDPNDTEKWDESTTTSESQSRDHMTSDTLMADTDCEADVSNMSDVVLRT